MTEFLGSLPSEDIDPKVEALFTQMGEELRRLADDLRSGTLKPRTTDKLEFSSEEELQAYLFGWLWGSYDLLQEDREQSRHAMLQGLIASGLTPEEIMMAFRHLGGLP